MSIKRKHKKIIKLHNKQFTKYGTSGKISLLNLIGSIKIQLIYPKEKRYIDCYAIKFFGERFLVHKYGGMHVD